MPFLKLYASYSNMNNIKYNFNKGFTLIELMIVVAIIGILASIAMPVYIDYTARAQSAEGLTAVSGIQAELAVVLADTGSFPPAGSTTHTAAQALVGKYFVATGVTVGDGNGVITTAFTSGANAGGALILTPTKTAVTNQISKWTCTPGGTMTNARLPSGCK